MTTDARPADRAVTGNVSRLREGPLRSAVALVAVVAGLLALAGALLLPFAPVAVSTPEVRWPPDPRDPAPTMLMVTAYEPAALDARFSCRTARAAGTSPDGVVLSTMGPTSRDADEEALTVRSRDGLVSIRSGGDDLFTGPLPPGDCRFVVAGDAAAMRVVLDGAVLSTTPSRMPPADPDELPDSEPERKPITPLPQVDALRTSVAGTPVATADDLSVRLTLDDAFDHSPAPLKSALIVSIVVALGVGAAATGVLALLAARARRDREGGPRERLLVLVRRRLGQRAGAAPWGLRPRLVDVVVPAVLVAWLFLAPLTDDDSYYSAMAGNVPFSGYVSNFYQLYNQGYTPFSWPYYALSWWQGTVGVAPVALRIPALVLGIGTWFLARAFVSSTPLLGPRGLSGWWAPAAARLALAAAFLAWWLPYDMGVRPEPVVAFFTLAALVAVAEGLERRRLGLIGLAVGLATVGLMAAPTGFIALAPLVAATPAAWRLIRERASGGWTAAGCAVLVLAPVAVGSLLGFADGAYRDFVRSQEIFAPIQRAQTWYEEFLRYDALLNSTYSHGSYARRTALLVCFLGLAWFVVLVVAARARDLVVPARLPLAGWSTLLAFFLLLPTPSKPTHHLGAFAGLGAVFLAVLLIDGPRLLAALDRHHRVPRVALLAAAAGAALVFALAGHGRILWPHGWGLGSPSYGDYPSVWGLPLDDPLGWALALAIASGAVWLAARRWVPHLRRLAPAVAVSLMVGVVLVTSTAWMVGDFSKAAARTATTYSPQVDAWDDPGASRCGLAQQIDVLDPRGGRVLPTALAPGADSSPPVPPVDAPDTPPAEFRTEPFLPGAFLPSDPPPPDLPPGTPAWGSFLVPEPGANADARTGSFATDWFHLPPPSPGVGLVVSVSGRTGEDVSLRAEYGRQTPQGFLPIASTPLGNGEETTAWRSVGLTDEVAPPPGAQVVRLLADDRSTTTGGWLAFSAPLERAWIPLQRYLPPDGAVGLPWSIGFLFPCLRQPRQQAGVTEPAVAAIGYGVTAGQALADWPFDPDRGGLLGHAERESTATLLTTRVRDVGDEIDDVFVFDLRQPYTADGYELTRRREVVPGLR